MAQTHSRPQDDSETRGARPKILRPAMKPTSRTSAEIRRAVSKVLKEAKRPANG